MRFREKILVLIVAVVVSVLVFNLIATSSVCLLKAAKEAGYGPIDTDIVRCKPDAHRIRHIDNKASFLSGLHPDS